MVDTNIDKDSIFEDTIFEEVVLGETTTADVEFLLENRFLEYEYENIDLNDYSDSDGRRLVSVYTLFGKTTITDEFNGWNAFYRYVMQGSSEMHEAEYLLSEWTVQLLLNEDSEYREAAQYSQ